MQRFIRDEILNSLVTINILEVIMAHLKNDVENSEKELRYSLDSAKSSRSSYFVNWEIVSFLPKSNGKVSKNISCKTDYKSLISGTTKKK